MMKKAVYVMMALAALGGFISMAGCGQAPQTQAAPDAQFQEKIRVFEADMMARLQDMETRLDMLQGHGLNLPEAAKESWLEWSGKFSAAQEAFEGKLKTANSQTSATWSAFQEELTKDWESIEAAFAELKKIKEKRE